ncbi:MAG: exopolysaccharide biosynthesis polyprenyl glycosylphosphotransferase [Suipraeoptans sp.]
MHSQERSGWFKHYDFIILDLLCLHISLLCGFLIRFGFENPYNSLSYRKLYIILFCIDLLIFILSNSFKNILKRGIYREFIFTFKHIVKVLLCALMYLFITKNTDDFSRIYFTTAFILYGLISYSVRIVWKYKVTKSISNNEGDRRLLIISNEKHIKDALLSITSNNYGRFKVVGVVLRDTDVNAVENDAIENYMRFSAIDEVYIDVPKGDEIDKDTIDKMLEMGIVVHRKLSDVRNEYGRKYELSKMGHNAILTTGTNVVSRNQLIIKRIMDIAGGLVECVFTGVLMLIIAPLIYIKSPGPVLFSQTRVGRNGRRFKLYKFRSMYPDAEERKAALSSGNKFEDGLMFKMKYDPRIIGNEKGRGVGYFIRNHSLDEFPQFFNVLKGDMSLVGTRPPTLDEWEKYDISQRGRMAIKPGVTGIWQISDRDNISDFNKIVELDKEYIYGEWTVGRDIKIILKTCLSVLKG